MRYYVQNRELSTHRWETVGGGEGFATAFAALERAETIRDEWPENDGLDRAVRVVNDDAKIIDYTNEYGFKPPKE